MERLVHAFVQENISIPGSKSSNQKQREQAIIASKAFFKSQMNIMVDLVRQMKQLYSEKENQNFQLKKRIDQYEKRLRQEKLQSENKEFKTRARQPSFTGNPTHQRKTIKGRQHQGDLSDIFVQVHTLIDDFDSKPMMTENKMQRQRQKSNTENSEGEIKHLKAQLSKNVYIIQNQDKQILQIKNKINQFSEERVKLIQKSMQLDQENNKILRDLNYTKQGYKTLQQRYNALETAHGEVKKEYEIKLQNLRQLLRGIKQNSSSKKSSPNKEQGYYSINRPFRNQGQQSWSSANSGSSNSQNLVLSQEEINLKQENIYLRQQLIISLDQKGEMRSKISQQQKKMEKYKSQLKSMQKQNDSIGSVQNSMNHGNVSKTDIQKNNANPLSFKKNKDNSVLCIQNADTKKVNKQKEQQRSNKNRNCIIEMFQEIYQILNRCYTWDQKLDKRTLPGRFKNFEDLPQKLKRLINDIEIMRTNSKELMDQNSKLKKQKYDLELKIKNDRGQVKDVLKQITSNPSQALSCDSTDKTFKAIQLTQINQGSIKVQQDKKKSIPFSQETNNLIYQFNIKQAKYQSQITRLKLQIQEAKFQYAYLQLQLKDIQLDLQEERQNSRQKFVPHIPTLNLTPKAKSTNSQAKNSIKKATVSISQQQQNYQSLFQMAVDKYNQFYQNSIRELVQWQYCNKNNLQYPLSQQLSKQIFCQKQNGISIPEIQEDQENMSKSGVKSQNFKLSIQSSVEIMQKSIPKIQQELKTIKDRSLNSEIQRKSYDSRICLEDQMFQKLKVSQIKFLEQQQTIEEIINKRLSEFRQLSRDLIFQFVPKSLSLSDESQNNAIQEIQQAKEVELSTNKVKCIEGSKSDRPKVQTQNEINMQEIDSKSQYIASAQLNQEQQLLFIRQEDQYYVQDGYESLKMHSQKKKIV